MIVKSKATTQEAGKINPNIKPNKKYWVIGFDDENYRILNDLKEPVLYPKYLFDVVDGEYPNDWEKVEYDDGEYFVDPPELSGIDFYEKYFDGNVEAREIFLLFCKKNPLEQIDGDFLE